jgi:hypothetical protein
MTPPDDATEARLRAMFRQAAADIRPTGIPVGDTTPSRTPRRVTVRLALGVAVFVVAGVSLTVAVDPWGGGGTGVGNGTGSGDALLTVKANGAVELLAPDSGAVLSTLVGPAPVDSDGRHLASPEGVTASHDVAYVAYQLPTPVIESIPFDGGTPTFVTNGRTPSVSPDGSQLAFFRSSGPSSVEELVVRDLTTGAEQTVDATISAVAGSEVSWSTDRSELALTGLFDATAASGGGTDIVGGVQVLTLAQPLSSTNPHFLGAPTTFAHLEVGGTAWADGQFLSPGGHIAVLSGGIGGGCQPDTPTTVLDVDPTTLQTTTVASFPFSITNAVFDHTGQLVAFERTLPQSGCNGGTTTTVPGQVAGSLLERWSGGVTVQLADGVAAVAFVGP